MNPVSAVKAYLADHPRARAIDIAAAVGCTEADALAALSEGVWRLEAGLLDEVLAEIFGWARVMVLVRNQNGVAEVTVPGGLASRRGDWLNWIDPAYNLHLRVGATVEILALTRPGKNGLTCSFNLVDEGGRVFCRFYARTPATQKRFLSFVQNYPTT